MLWPIIRLVLEVHHEDMLRSLPAYSVGNKRSTSFRVQCDGIAERYFLLLVWRSFWAYSRVTGEIKTLRRLHDSDLMMVDMWQTILKLVYMNCERVAHGFSGVLCIMYCIFMIWNACRICSKCPVVSLQWRKMSVMAPHNNRSVSSTVYSG